MGATILRIFFSAGLFPALITQKAERYFLLVAIYVVLLGLIRIV